MRKSPTDRSLSLSGSPHPRSDCSTPHNVGILPHSNGGSDEGTLHAEDEHEERHSQRNSVVGLSEVRGPRVVIDVLGEVTMSGKGMEDRDVGFGAPQELAVDHVGADVLRSFGGARETLLLVER